MAPLTSYTENALGSIFSFAKGRDDKLFSRLSPATTKRPPTVTLSSPELGAASPGAFVAGKHELLGANEFPELHWTLTSEDADNVRSWLLLVEDADAPLPSPIVHGLYYDIPAATRSLSQSDFKPDHDNHLSGNFRYGANRRGTIWTGPRPVLGHGAHRYFFQILGLNVATFAESNKSVSKEVLLDAVTNLGPKVVCWGEYMASFERRL